MSEKIKCCLIKDLLPSYIDELCAEQSRKLIEEHLKDCPDCRATFEAMKDDGKPVEKVAVDDAAIIKKANEKLKKDINKRTIPTPRPATPGIPLSSWLLSILYISRIWPDHHSNFQEWTTTAQLLFSCSRVRHFPYKV